jgi:hypothetical protein
MGILEDVIKALERIPAWKRMTALTDDVARLQARVTALEAAMKPATGSKCPKCGLMAFGLALSQRDPGPFGDMGAMQDIYRCSSCSYERIENRDPG